MRPEGPVAGTAKRHVGSKPESRMAPWIARERSVAGPDVAPTVDSRGFGIPLPGSARLTAHGEARASDTRGGGVRHRDAPLCRFARVEGALQSGGRPARQLHRMDAATTREEPPPRGRQPAVPDPALDPYPQPRLAHPRHRAPPPARGRDRALPHHPRAHRDLRRDPAPHRRHLQGIGLGPCRNHPGTRALR